MSPNSCSKPESKTCPLDYSEHTRSMVTWNQGYRGLRIGNLIRSAIRLDLLSATLWTFLNYPRNAFIYGLIALIIQKCFATSALFSIFAANYGYAGVSPAYLCKAVK